MTSALSVAMTGMDAQQTQLNQITNNLANSTTTGFKKGRAVFEDLAYQTIRQTGAQASDTATLPTGLMLGSGVKVVATQKMFSQGELKVTSNELDVAIQGEGFFQITLGSETLYTRKGSFQQDTDGNIVDANGNLLTPTITIPSGTTAITISTDGTVSATVDDTPTTVGQIMLATFPNKAGLEARGGTMFAETVSSGSPTTAAAGSSGVGTTNQGSLEESNVNVVEELVNLIETQRAMELNSKAVSTVDSILGFITQTL